MRDLEIILASQSPRRRELLTSAGVRFAVRTAHTEERLQAGELPCETVMRLAREKAAAVAKTEPGRIVLGADTLVALGDLVLGKPKTLTEAHAMLEQLSGREQQVYTGVCLLVDGGRCDNWYCQTTVFFKQLSSNVIDEYLSLVNPLDKAGGYAIQEHGDMIIERLDGLLSNVIGLPVEEVVEHLASWPEV